MVKIENDVVIPSKTTFYCIFVDDINSRLKLGDNFSFDWLKNYHPNNRLTIEVNPIKFLKAKLITSNGAKKFSVYWENTTLPSPLTSKTSKHLKRDTMNGDLHRSKRIPPNFAKQIPSVKKNYEGLLPIAFHWQCS